MHVCSILRFTAFPGIVHATSPTGFEFRGNRYHPRILVGRIGTNFTPLGSYLWTYTANASVFCEHCSLTTPGFLSCAQ